MTPAPSVAALAATLVLGGAALAGCGSGDEPGSTSAGGISVIDAWIRPTPPITNVGAFYFRLENGSDHPDQIVGASSPRCAEIDIHRTTEVDGVLAMVAAEPADLLVAPGAELVFAPSGLHLMCLGLTEPVVEGDEVPFTLELDRAGSLTVEAQTSGVNQRSLSG